MRKRLKKYRKHIWCYIAIASIFYLAFLGIFLYSTAQIGIIFPNIYIGNTNFGGLTKNEAREILSKKTNTLIEQGAVVSIKNKNIKLNLSHYAQDPDLTRNLIDFNISKTADALYSVGRNKYNPIKNVSDIIKTAFLQKQMEMTIEFDKKKIKESLKAQLTQYESPAQNAALVFEDNQIKIISDKEGYVIDYENLLSVLEAQLKVLQTPYITIQLHKNIPQIKKYEIEDRVPEVENILARAPFIVKYGERKWEINSEMIKNFLIFEKQNGVAVPAISMEKSKKIFDVISKEINTPARNAKFIMKDGKVTEFQTSQLGTKINQGETLVALNSVLQNGFPGVNAIIESDVPEVTTSNANNLGINDYLGKGESSFYGSPQNRVHNIRTGADILNGLLIEPGEEFSLIKALGKIDAEHGFKAELVIKEGRTIPEFGGGLCQIGTTLFRAAIDSGFPILERKSHSYRVGYYEPAGTDATIYNPSPDLKFKNDTSGYVLLQTKVHGTDLTFEFWGQSDGREVTHTKPIIYNIKNPPAVKYIYTDELAPGQKRKIESAHKGADAYFKRTITYTNGKEKIDETFYSHYVPWAEVWLIGTTSTPES